MVRVGAGTERHGAGNRNAPDAKVVAVESAEGGEIGKGEAEDGAPVAVWEVEDGALNQRAQIVIVCHEQVVECAVDGGQVVGPRRGVYAGKVDLDLEEGAIVVHPGGGRTAAKGAGAEPGKDCTRVIDKHELVDLRRW